MTLCRTWTGVLASLVFGLAAHAQESGPSLVTFTEGKVKDAFLVSRTAGRRDPIVGVVERVKAAVVNIHSERTVPGQGHDAFALTPSQNRINGMGTGIIIDPRGYIVTNHHVVEDVSIIRTRLADGTSQNALVVARSLETDLALLKIEPREPLPTMPLGTASDLMVGEKVVAIGNAYGYEHTVSVGVVSAVKRDVSLNKDMAYKGVIQTDASINPGNSGGPLLNVHGELVGVNVAIRAGAQGIGFAIPVDSMVRVVADMLRARRRAQHYDGLVCRDVLEQVPEGTTRMVVVDRLEGAPAGSLRRGDVLVQVGDVAIGCSLDVERALLERKSGDTVPVVVRRQSQEQRVELTLQSPDRMRAASNDVVWTKLGLQLAPASPDAVARVNRQLHGGLEVTGVNNDGVAAKAGIKRGDILIGLHQWETLTMENVIFVLGHPELGTFNPLAFYIVRSGQVRRGWLQAVN
jgi:serine protease Do